MAVENLVDNLDLVISKGEQRINVLGVEVLDKAQDGRGGKKLVDSIYLLHRGIEMLQYNYTEDQLSNIITEMYKLKLTDFSSSPLSPFQSSILNNILVQGEKGPQGYINVTIATEGDRSTYDDQPEGYTVYASATGRTSSKLSDADGDWGDWVNYTATGTPTVSITGIDGGSF